MKKVLSFIFILISFLIILFRSFYISIIQYDKYKYLLENVFYTSMEGNNAPRGKIYDRNHKLLVDNINIKNIYYKKESGVSVYDEIRLAKEISGFLELNYELATENMLKDLWLVLNNGNEKISD